MSIALGRSQGLRGKTILVVEDEPLIRNFAVGVLKRQGCIALGAADGIEGSTLFARDFNAIDLLITDISLPGMRGPDLAAYARKLRPDLRILFMSGSVQFEERNPIELFAGSAFLPKPFTLEDFTNAVAKALDVDPSTLRESSVPPLKDIAALDRI
jgi:two-component system cell cycle sensor histidine kinase/response regulator CckA